MPWEPSRAKPILDQQLRYVSSTMPGSQRGPWLQRKSKQEECSAKSTLRPCGWTVLLPWQSCRPTRPAAAVQRRLSLSSGSFPVRRTHVAGWALQPCQPRKGKVASQASVFFEAAEELAAGHPTSKAQMLGYILAHEIGHLLLGEGSHSGKGIMRTPWLTQEMDDLARGWLGFTAKQANRMKADLLARGRLAATSDSLGLRPGFASETTVQRPGSGSYGGPCL